MAASQHILVDRVSESGSAGKVVRHLCHIVKRVKFVAIDQGINMEEVSYHSPVPVFYAVTNHIHVARSGTRYRQTIDTMPLPQKIQGYGQGKIWLKTILLAVSIAILYSILFWHIDAVMDYWTQGGIYSILPPLTALCFCCLQIALADAFCLALATKRHLAKNAAPVTQAPELHASTDTFPAKSQSFTQVNQ